MGTTSIEDVAAADPDGRNWFQLYMWKDRDRSMAPGRAGRRGRLRHAAGHGRRPGRRGAAARRPQRHDHPADADAATCSTRSRGRPGGSTSSPPSRWPSPPSTGGPAPSPNCSTRMFDPTRHLRRPGLDQGAVARRLVVKGVQTVADARRVADLGVDGIAALQPRRSSARPGAGAVAPAARRRPRGRRRHRGLAGHRHHERRRHRRGASPSAPGSPWSDAPTCTG